MALSDRAKSVKFCGYGRHHAHEEIKPNLVWSFEQGRCELVHCCDTCYRQATDKYLASVPASDGR